MGATFISHSDLIASMGILGQQTHPEVVTGVKKSIATFVTQGKPVGVNAFTLDQAQD